jgi:hypothetical protein
MRRSAFDGDPSCGEGVSNLDGGLDARLLLSGLALREDPPNEDRNDRTRERTMLAITDLVHTGTEGQLL